MRERDQEESVVDYLEPFKKYCNLNMLEIPEPRLFLVECRVTRWMKHLSSHFTICSLVKSTFSENKIAFVRAPIDSN